MPLSLDLAEEGFVLRRTTDQGESRMELSEEDVLTLIQSAQAFRERILSRHQPAAGGAQAILVSPIEDVAFRPDSLHTSALMFLQATTGAQVTFALSPEVARRLLERLPICLAELEAPDTTRQ